MPGQYMRQFGMHPIVDDFAGIILYLINEKFYDVLLSIPEEHHLDRELRNKGKFIVCNPFTVVSLGIVIITKKNLIIYLVTSIEDYLGNENINFSLHL